MKKIRKISCIFLAALLIILASASAFGVTYKTETVNERLGKVKLQDEYDMWHYSNGTWKVGNAYSSFTWTDAEIGGAMNIGRTLQAKTRVTYKWTLPEEWLAQTGDGLKLLISIAPISKSWSDWYNTASFTQNYSNGTVTYTFIPYYHISSLRSFDDYIAGLKVSMPLIDITWGNNLYSIFKNSSNLGRSEGRYWDNYPTGITSGYMHPQFIKNYTGVLKSGYTIDTESGRFSTAGLSVGTNTLVNGGALGLLFKFPLYATVDLKGTRTVAVYTPEEQAEQEKIKQQEERAQLLQGIRIHRDEIIDE